MLKTIINRALSPFAIFLLLLLTLVVTSPRVLSSIDSMGSELLPISIIQDHDFYLDEFRPNFPTLPPQAFSQINGHLISSYPIIPAVLNTPVYFLAHLAGTDLLANQYVLSKLTCLWITSLSATLVYLMLRKITSIKTAILGAFLYVFTTGMWSWVSMTMYGHGSAILFINATLLCLVNNHKRSLSLSGLFLGFAFFARPATLPIVLPLTIYVLLYKKHIRFQFLALMAIPLTLLAIYSHYYWGSIWALGQINTISWFDGDLFVGIIGNLFSPSRGLLIFTPLAIFSIAYILISLKRKHLSTLDKYFTISMTLSFLTYAQWRWWWSASSFGNRFLTEIAVFLIYFFILAWDRYIQRNTALKAITIILIIWSIGVHFLGSHYYPCGHFDDLVNQEYDDTTKTARLWSIRQSQLVFCTRKMLGTGR